MLPFVAILLAGVVDVGRGFYARVVLANAVREGARYGARHPSDEEGIADAVRSELATTRVRSLSQSSITISTPDGTDAEDPLTVAASYDMPFFLGRLLGIQTTTIRAGSTMMIEK